jgi:ABC-2 type transport system permease protein
MAVHKRSYHRYAGELTPPWSRFLIVSRYAFKNALRSKAFIAFFVLCFFYPLGCILALYMNHNERLLALFHTSAFFAVDARFFFHFQNVQGTLAFILTALVGPGLVSPDLANHALPFYFCRPFSRVEYVLGKLYVLVSLLSLVTWIPGELLFLIQSTLAGASWMRTNLWMAGSILLGSAIEILLFSLLALALSAWIKRKLAAGAALLGVFFFGAGFGQAINAVLRTNNGSLIDLANLISRVESQLFRQYAVRPVSIPADWAWLVLLAISAFCLLLLEKKVKAYEVVRG